MINESFICGKCTKKITIHPQGSARNHCPHCLFSKHLDKEYPGDRKSHCFGLMPPIDLEYKKNKGYMIKHCCKKCNKDILNKVAPDDNLLEFTENRNKLLKYKI